MNRIPTTMLFCNPCKVNPPCLQNIPPLQRSFDLLKCQGTLATATGAQTSVFNRLRFFSNLVAIFPTGAKSQKQVNFPRIEFLETATKLRGRKRNLQPCVNVLNKTSLEGIPTRSREVTVKKCTKRASCTCFKLPFCS